MKKILLFTLVLLQFLSGCVSSKKALNSGNYDQAIYKSVNKLRKNPDNSKEILVLERAFSRAQQNDFDRIAFMQKEGSPDKWDDIYNVYEQIKNRQAQVKALPVLVIKDKNKQILRNANFSFINVDDELLEAKQKAAQFFYTRGNTLLQKGGRFNARDAYADFQQVKNYYSTFQDVDDKLAAAQEAGTTKVLFKMQKDNPGQLPPSFEQELLKISLQELNRQWMRYYTSDVKGTTYDYNIVVNLKVIDVSPDLVKEKYYSESKKIKDGWEYKLDAKGNVTKDSLGNDIKQPKYKTIKCDVVETHFSKSARVAGTLDYIDNNSKQLLHTDNIAADSFFEDGVVVVLGGDVNALTPETKARIGKKPLPYPDPFGMLLQAGGTLKGMVKNLLFQNTAVLQ